MGAQPARPLNGDGPVVISGTGTVITPVVQMEKLRLVEGASAMATLNWLSRPVFMNPNASARPPLGTPGRTLPPAAPPKWQGEEWDLVSAAPWPPSEAPGNRPLPAMSSKPLPLTPGGGSAHLGFGPQGG